MAVGYAALCACRKVHTWRLPISENRSFFYFGCSLVRRFYCKINKNNNGTDGQTDRRTDRVRRNMRPPPREEGRIIMLGETEKSSDVCRTASLSETGGPWDGILTTARSNSDPSYLLSGDMPEETEQFCKSDTTQCIVARLKPGNVHMWFSSRSGYRPFLTRPPAIWT